MKVLITGATSGIGREFLKLFALSGYEITAVARNEKKLEKIKADYSNISYEACDLTIEEDCVRLFKAHPDSDIVINCAGMGVFGEFTKTDLEKELSLLELNIKAVHILTKLYLSEMTKRNSGYIMNVSSSASFFTGPLFSSYYASKAYVTRLTRAIAYELKKQKSNVKVSVFCPGPVDTKFWKTAGMKTLYGAITPEYAAKYAAHKMLLGKTLIIPGISAKISYLLSQIIPESITQKAVYILQKSKTL